jgi:hypothetical protein
MRINFGLPLYCMWRTVAYKLTQIMTNKCSLAGAAIACFLSNPEFSSSILVEELRLYTSALICTTSEKPFQG